MPFAVCRSSFIFRVASTRMAIARYEELSEKSKSRLTNNILPMQRRVFLLNVPHIFLFTFTSPFDAVLLVHFHICLSIAVTVARHRNSGSVQVFVQIIAEWKRTMRASFAWFFLQFNARSQQEMCAASLHRYKTIKCILTQARIHAPGVQGASCS